MGIQPTLTSLVRIDRAEPLSYPESMERLMFPELQISGPQEYDLSIVEPYYITESHRKRTRTGGLAPKDIEIIGYHLYLDILRKNEISRCLGLADAVAISKVEPEIYRHFFKAHGSLLCFKSTILTKNGLLEVPYLWDGQVKWGNLLMDCIGDPIARFKSE